MVAIQTGVVVVEAVVVVVVVVVMVMVIVVSKILSPIPIIKMLFLEDLCFLTYGSCSFFFCVVNGECIFFGSYSFFVYLCVLYLKVVDWHPLFIPLVLYATWVSTFVLVKTYCFVWKLDLHLFIICMVAFLAGAGYGRGRGGGGRGYGRGRGRTGPRPRGGGNQA